jgi:hypothetical protein
MADGSQSEWRSVVKQTDSYNNPYRTALLLIVVATGIMALAVLTNRGDMTSATMVMSSAGIFLTGIFILTFYKGEPLDPEMVSLLPVQGTINIATLCADLGVRGNASFIPVQRGNQMEVVQVIPFSSYQPKDLSGSFSYITEPDSAGIRIAPTCVPLMQWLEEKHGLSIPGDEAQVFDAIKDIFASVLELAEDVEIERTGNTITFVLSGYRLVSGCAAVQEVSPKCCTMVGCPVCSLISCIVSRGMESTCSITRATYSEKAESLSMSITLNE